MEAQIEAVPNGNLDTEIPKFIVELNKFTVTLNGDVKIIDLFDPPGIPKDPPQGWLAELSRLELNQKAIINATLGSARVNGFETIDSIRELTIEKIIAKSASSSLRTFRTIGLKRATILKQLFEKNTADVKSS